MSDIQNWPNPDMPGYPRDIGLCWPHLLMLDGRKQIFVWYPGVANAEGSWSPLDPYITGTSSCSPITMAESASYIKEAHFNPTVVIRDSDIELRAHELFDGENPDRTWSLDSKIGARDHLNSQLKFVTIDEKAKYRDKALKALIAEYEKSTPSPA
ncbi:hypothetical protein [Gluconobacter cerinus]|uniref:hypothetical protein n=1 Tax=Gluconobacter cerinus TaxID=38307 RepID=UPI001B8ACF00|nr:hypothetical protein [Gluconobacter cerinus]MBS1067229.1 hypothetical protein [Gluconobacter cerinus]